MGELKQIKINNSKKAAISNTPWHDPGAKLYDTLMDAYYCDGKLPAGSKELDRAIKEKKYLQWFDFLKEAYLIAPVDKIANSPYGRTPFSRSGCKYPHHVIKNGELVLSVQGVKAAYSRAAQMRDIKGEVRDHLKKHLDELGIKYSERAGSIYFGEDVDIINTIERNFDDIKSYLSEKTGINLSFDIDGEYDEPLNESIISNESINEYLEWIERFANDEEFQEQVMSEASHGKLKYDFRLGWDYNTGHQIKIVYSLDNINITGVGDFYWKYNKDNRNPDGSLKMNEDQYKDYVRKNIRSKGNNDHQSTGQKVLAIVDLVTNRKLNNVTLMSPISLDGTNERFTRYTAIPESLLGKARNMSKSNNGISTVRVGEIDNSKSFKVTSWGLNTINKRTGEDLRFNQLSKKESLKDGRGYKVNDIIPEDLRVFGYDGKPPVHYNNPNKKQALIELNARAVDCDNLLKALFKSINSNQYPKGWDKESTIRKYKQIKAKLSIIENDINLIKAGKYNLSIMDKYRNDDFFINMRLHESYNYHNEDYRPPSNYFGTLTCDADRLMIREDIEELSKYIEENYEDIMESDIDSTSNLTYEDSIKELFANDEEFQENDVTNNNLNRTDKYLSEEAEDPDIPPVIQDDDNSDDNKESMPKQTDAAESNKNGVRRKKLYIAFIEWAKEYNNKTEFGSLYDKDIFKVTYPFIPEKKKY